MSASPLQAQTEAEFDFADPLDEIRQTIDRVQPDQSSADIAARSTPEAAPEALAETGAEESGETSAWSVLLPILLALAVIGALFWWLFGRSERSTANRDGSLYSTGASSPRRKLESGALVTAREKPALDTSEPDPDEKATASKAAIMDADDETADEKAAAEEPPAKPIFSKRRDQGVADADRGARFDAAQDAAAAETDPEDPSTWRRPNLERLKASIRSDWKSGGEARRAVATKPVYDDVEAEAFAALFKDSEPANDDAKPATDAKPAAKSRISDLSGSETAARSPVLDMLDAYDSSAETDGGDTLPLTELAPEEDLPPARAEIRPEPRDAASIQSREDALRRVKALREAVAP